MHTGRVSWAAALCITICANIAAAATLEVKTNRADALYHAGDPVTFEILLRDGNDGDELECVVTHDGQFSSSHNLINHGETIRVTHTWKGPRFLKCEVTYRPPA